MQVRPNPSLLVMCIPAHLGGGGEGGGGLGGGGDGGSGLHRGHIGSKFCTNTRVIGRWQHT